MGSFRFSGCFFSRNIRAAEVAPPAEMEEMFEKYAEGGTHMTAEHLWRFLAEVQGHGGVSLEEAEQIIEQVLQRWHHIAKFTRKTLTFDDFHHYLFSADLNPPIDNQVYQDMTSPLSHYFIYTGHNSYLTGNQLSSHSSDVPIIKALKRGVRAIELDLWPNSSKNNVLVLHGRTLTTPVKLTKCLKAIKEFAFSASPYPVILTLEDHLTADLQAKVAQMITQTFGEMLYCSESECLTELPSPEELKYRIIISTKLPKEKLEAKSMSGRKHKKKGLNEDVLKEPSDLSSNQADHEKGGHNHWDKDNKVCSCESHSFQAPEYKRLIAIQSGKLTDRLKKELSLELEKVHRISLSEDKFKKASESYGTDVVRFTQKSILRIYPKQTRFNSSNYNPITGWKHGAQMVAFNMQGYGKYLWLMHGMFRANEGCGYVKKPYFLINTSPDGQVFNPKDQLSVKKTLKVKVYLGDGWHLDFNQSHFKFWSPPQLYTRVGIAGVPADKTMKKTKKRVGSWKPVWNEEFGFPLTVPELALLRVEVHKYNMSDKDDFAGQTCLPVFQLRPGIRAVPLYDRKGEILGFKLCLSSFSPYQVSTSLSPEMAASKQAFKFCFFFKRIFKLRVSEPPEDIRNLFEDYSENGAMNVEGLHRFLKDVQNDDSDTTEHAQEIFNSLKHLFIFQRRELQLDAFFRYLLGDLNLPISTMVHQDMEAPLSHYYLFTGHNSYLTGNQLSSDSSVEPIIKALHRGVRVIELDLWPNKKANDVKVCHGGTLTSPVDLIKCLRAIKDNAFVASEFPVVITFEDHLTPNLQHKVAQMVTKVFGDMLYQPIHLEEFPSPESLKKKIMISTKPPEEYQKDGDNKEKGKLEKTLSSQKHDPKIGKSYTRISSAANDQDQPDDGDFMEEADEEKTEYRKLIAIHAMKLKGRLEKILQNIDPHKVSRLSMSEQQLENAVDNNLGPDIVRFTQRNLLRVYPKGTRITSSNYNPFVGWEHGAQMVAFNMQGIGKHLRIMQGMFRGNGGCGYVKKPDFLLGKYAIDKSKVIIILKMKIYLGEGWDWDFHRTHFDWFSPPDFFAKVAIEGVEADVQKVTTKTILDQWVPEWNQEFEFPLRVPELALLRIEVFDYDDAGAHDFAGQTCLPVAELKSGIRAVPLHNREGDQYKYTRLLVRFQFDEV